MIAEKKRDYKRLNCKSFLRYFLILLSQTAGEFSIHEDSLNLVFIKLFNFEKIDKMFI